MTVPRAEPLNFGPADRPCFGWLHLPRADAPRRDVGLVICNPFGYEAICAHRSLRHFAEAATAIGVPALRFDYDGTGDSAGDDRDPQRWPAWIRSVHDAIDTLRRLSGVQRVHLLGVRLGAAIAVSASADRQDVAGLIAIVPVLAGKPWLRELNALEIAMGFAGPPPELKVPSGEQESVGFVITDETKLALQSIDLASMNRAPADVLLVNRDDLPPNAKWAERLSALGARVDHRRLPGYAEMMLDPHESVPPVKMIAAVMEWLDERSGVAHASPPPSVPAPPVAVLVAPGVEETAAFLDETRTLFGIVSAPARASRPSRAIVLLNAGGNPRIGPSRMYVHLARRWATRGFLVLRFDQAGIGDSAPYPGDSEGIVYSTSAVRGVEAALAYLRNRWGAVENQALGLCSGAYHALKAAAAGLPLKGVAIINPLVFFWKPGMSLAYPSYQVSLATASYKRSFLQLEKWKKLFSGNVNVVAVARVLAQRLALRAEVLVRDVARAVGKPLRDDLGAELQSVARRGVALHFVFATGDPGEDLLRTEAGWSLRGLRRDRQLHIRRIQGPNHSFTPVWTRTVLTEVLETELDVR